MMLCDGGRMTFSNLNSEGEGREKGYGVCREMKRWAEGEEVEKALVIQL
jgi:hypothetical protein